MKGKRLQKSRNRRVCGVCGGIAEYMGIDPFIIRLVYVMLLATTGIGILPYIIAAIIMDEPTECDAPQDKSEERTYTENIYYESDEPVGFKPSHEDSGEIRGFSI